jgi:signal transduction histidine kinase
VCRNSALAGGRLGCEDKKVVIGGAVTEIRAPFTEVVIRAAANAHDLERLCRPLLGALAEFAGMDSAYLMVIDWDRRTQTVRFVHNVGAIEVAEGLELESPPGLSPQALLGVTVSPDLPETHPDSQVAKHLSLGTYVSVPIVTADHQLFGVLCAAGRIPREVDEATVSMMEFLARLIADHVSRQKSAMTELRADAAEDKLRNRALFLAEAEHHLQTPLRAVIDSARALQTRRERLTDDEWYEAVVSIHVNTQTLARQIDKLLEEAQAELQARSLHLERLELSELLRMTAKGFAAFSCAHEVRFDDTGEVWARVDRAALHHVLGNLIDNAIKYSPDGCTVSLRARHAPDHVEIEVTDAGVGLVQGAEVFAPFQRGGDETTVAVAGAGLGLHIVRNLVEAMGGTVSARPNPDRGSTFVVSLPVAR